MATLQKQLIRLSEAALILGVSTSSIRQKKAGTQNLILEKRPGTKLLLVDKREVEKLARDTVQVSR